VRETPPEFCGKDEVPVAGDVADPLVRVSGMNGAVEGCVYLDAVEVLRKMPERISLRGRIDYVLPVLIRPAGDADLYVLLGYGCYFRSPFEIPDVNDYISDTGLIAARAASYPPTLPGFRLSQTGRSG